MLDKRDPKKKTERWLFSLDGMTQSANCLSNVSRENESKQAKLWAIKSEVTVQLSPTHFLLTSWKYISLHEHQPIGEQTNWLIRLIYTGAT